ncbi:MAG: protein-export chaperone SecB, partial [Pseudomonadota bacterium]
MTDQGSEAQPNGNDATEGTQPQVQMLGQYLKDVSFESPKAPQSLNGQVENPKMHIDVNVKARKVADDVYESTIDFNARSTSDGATIFEIEVTYAGLARLKDVPDDMLQPILL